MLLFAGIWKSKEELISLRRTERKFEPNTAESDAAKNSYKEWLRAVDRSREWRRVPAS